MEDTTTISNPSMEPLLFSVDPISLLLSQNTKSLSTFERGPKYNEYAKLRESKLRMKRDFERILKEEEERFFGNNNNKPRKIKVSPEKTRFGFNRRSSLGQSVPDFSTMIRKENRRPGNSNLLPKRAEVTPPSMKSRNISAIRGSISASAGEKKMGMARKSYAAVEDLKRISTAAASAINGGRKSIGGGAGRNVLGYRQVY